MKTDADLYYRALESKDRRFDGTFFVAVVTTGIYCRPICPARTAKRKNVRFYACAAAAESAGFRPCRRCRPETAPGSPAWAGTSATVSRALRLIHEGALDGAGVDDLSDRLGVGSRHLRRLFDEHLGASPVAVAQSRRLHFARQLVDETSLPMTEVAQLAGFSSVRRFNDAMRASFGRAPRELRARAKAGSSADDGSVSLQLAYRVPYDWDAMWAYLERRQVPGVEIVADGTYRRSFVADGRPGWIAVRPDEERAVVRLRVSLSHRRSLMDIAERVRRLFDLHADPLRIARELGRDERLRRAVRRRPGLRVPGAWDPFELAVRAVLGQQVSVRGATTLAGRLVREQGEAVDGAPDGGPTHLFPTAERLAEANVAAVGMPEARGRAIRELARRVATGELSLSGGSSAEETQAKLLEIPGIGPWTAQYVTMRALGHPDTFLPGDLGVRRALANGSGRLPAARAAQERAEVWRPWRSYAVLHLWMEGADG